MSLLAPRRPATLTYNGSTQVVNEIPTSGISDGGCTNCFVIGSTLFAEFWYTVAGVTSYRIARWSGSAWVDIGARPAASPFIGGASYAHAPVLGSSIGSYTKALLRTADGLAFTEVGPPFSGNITSLGQIEGGSDELTTSVLS